MIWEKVFYSNIATYIAIINKELEKNFDLEPLSNHIKIQGGYAFKASEYKNEGVPVIRISDFQDEKIDLSSVRYYKEDKMFDKYQLNAGDIIIAMTGGTIGKLAIVQDGLGKLYLNQRVGKFEVLNKDEFEPEYTYWLARGIQNIVKNLGYGGAQPNVSNVQIESLRFPFPDKKTQASVIQFLNDLKNDSLSVKPYFNKQVEDQILKHQKTGVDLFTIINECNNQQDYLNLLRQSILQEAVQGKLVPQDVNDEPAEQLLQRIKAEKARLVKEGKLKKEKELPPVTEDEIPFELPKGWVWCRFKELGIITGGGTPSTSKPEYWSGNIPWITPKDMKQDFLSDAEDKLTLEGVKNSSAKLIPANSILIVGRSGILKRLLPVCINTVECSVNQDLKVLVPFLPETTRYIQIMLKGYQEYILNNLVKYGMTVHSLMYQEFELQPFPIPPISQQKRILEKIDVLTKLLIDFEFEIQQSKEQSQQLLQAILREAFAGGQREYEENEMLTMAAEE